MSHPSATVITPRDGATVETDTVTLAGDVTIEEEEVIERTVERVVCRWCGSADQIVEEESATS